MLYAQAQVLGAPIHGSNDSIINPYCFTRPLRDPVVSTPLLHDAPVDTRTAADDEHDALVA